MGLNINAKAEWKSGGRAAADVAGMDPVRFAREMLHFEPDAVQQIVLDRTILRGMLNCTRQWGKSTMMAVKALHQAYCYPETLTLVLAPTERQSGLLVEKAMRFARRIGLATKTDGLNKISMKLPNGSRIIGLPDKEKNIRGFDDVRLLLVDEAARVNEALYYEAANPMLNQREGAVWLLSTPNGKRGFFYDEWVGPEKWKRVRVPATECPRHSKDFLEEQLRKMGSRRFRQEFLCEFVDDDDSLFAREVVERSIRKEIKPLLRDFRW